MFWKLSHQCDEAKETMAELKAVGIASLKEIYSGFVEWVSSSHMTLLQETWLTFESHSVFLSCHVTAASQVHHATVTSSPVKLFTRASTLPLHPQTVS